MRVLPLALLLTAWTCALRGQEVSVSVARPAETPPREKHAPQLSVSTAPSSSAPSLPSTPPPTSSASPLKSALATSAWLDLRQSTKESGLQSAPEWVESIKLLPQDNTVDVGRPSIFRIRLRQPPVGQPGDGLLFVRLFFFDTAYAHPTVAAWDESRSQLLRSKPLGTGSNVENSDSVMLPMHGVRAINIEAPGDGRTIRGVYLEWMVNSEVAHSAGNEAQTLMPEPFVGSARLSTPERDFEQFGTVTAALGAEPIRIGPNSDESAVYEFGVETQPLVAMLTFEVAAARIDSPPQIAVNGEVVGPVSLTLPALADPGYRGEMRRLMHEMHFQYTGWLRAQALVPARLLKAGTNRIIVINGPNADNSVIRNTQIQLKYLWDKSDYILQPSR